MEVPRRAGRSLRRSRLCNRPAVPREGATPAHGSVWHCPQSAGRSRQWLGAVEAAWAWPRVNAPCVSAASVAVTTAQLPMDKASEFPGDRAGPRGSHEHAGRFRWRPGPLRGFIAVLGTNEAAARASSERRLNNRSWSRRSDSNRGPAVYETAALPLSYVGAGGSVPARPTLGSPRDDTRLCPGTWYQPDAGL